MTNEEYIKIKMSVGERLHTCCDAAIEHIELDHLFCDEDNITWSLELCDNFRGSIQIIFCPFCGADLREETKSAYKVLLDLKAQYK